MLLGIARQFGAFIIDFLDVALRAWSANDVLGPADPPPQPIEPLFAHALGQDGDAAAIEDARNRDPAAAVIPGRRPHRPVMLGVEPASHQARDQTAIGRQHLMRADQWEKARLAQRRSGRAPRSTPAAAADMPASQQDRSERDRCTSAGETGWPDRADRDRPNEGPQPARQGCSKGGRARRNAAMLRPLGRATAQRGRG